MERDVIMTLAQTCTDTLHEIKHSMACVGNMAQTCMGTLHGAKGSKAFFNIEQSVMINLWWHVTITIVRCRIIYNHVSSGARIIWFSNCVRLQGRDHIN